MSRLRSGLAAWLTLVTCFSAAGMELDRGDFAGGSYDLRGYLRVDEDLSLGADASPGVSQRTSDLRRVRLGVGALWDGDWVAHVAGNFARRSALRDLWLEYRGWPVRIEVGRFPEPFSLGESIASTDSLLATLASPAVLGPDYGLGVGFNYRGEDWGIAAGTFTRNGGPTLSGLYPESANTARVTWRPLAGEQGYLHVGLSASQRQVAPGAGVQLFGSAESGLLLGMAPQSPLVGAADRYRLLAAELMFRLGPVMGLAETIQAQVANGGPAWHGAYAEAAWCLTGEQRSYSTRYGTIGGISPDRPVDLGGWGAWEVAARWSVTDLSDGGGDRGQVATLGLNWYPVDAIRLSLIAQHAHLEPAGQDPRDSNLAQLLLQFSL
ncbi:MAG: hypothetical protein KGI67_02495 [Pseudomonadota bacterium]|nr:hypothetical protein [Pseudomonadota bacterium]